MISPQFQQLQILMSIEVGVGDRKSAGLIPVLLFRILCAGPHEIGSEEGGGTSNPNHILMLSLPLKRGSSCINNGLSILIGLR